MVSQDIIRNYTENVIRAATGFVRQIKLQRNNTDESHVLYNRPMLYFFERS